VSEFTGAELETLADLMVELDGSELQMKGGPSQDSPREHLVAGSFIAATLTSWIVRQILVKTHAADALKAIALRAFDGLRLSDSAKAFLRPIVSSLLDRALSLAS
jgi:2-keto-3-deoxy-6-phosphogluconate aldolase